MTRRLAALISILSLCACAAPPLPMPPVAGAPVSTPDIPVIVVDNQEKRPQAEPPPETPPPARKPDEYVITVEVNPEARTAVGTEQLIYQNRSDKPLDAILLNVYLNAFREGAVPVPYFERFAAKIFERGMDYGRLDILSVREGGAAAGFELSGTALRVDLAAPLPPGESVELTIAFDGYLPNINHRAGANDAAMWCGSLFPTAAVLDETGWHTEGYYPAGSPFHAASSNWTVHVVSPKACVVAGTGEETVAEAGDKRTTTITARMTRGFAFAVSRSFDMQTLKTTGGVYINFYHYSDIDGTAVLEAAERAFDGLGQLVGAYPYFSYDIVEAGLFSTETESYAGLTFMDTDYLRAPNVAALSAPADVARQYFGGVVGSCRFKETWLSEGLATFVGRMLRLDDEAALARDMTAEREQLAARLPNEALRSMKPGLSEYDDWGNYADTQRYRPRLMCYALRERMGAAKFGDFMKAYYAAFSFQQATGEDFKRLAQDAAGEDLTAFFNAWIAEDGLPPLR